MKTAVRTHYRAELLPEGLRPEGTAGGLVTVTVTVEEPPGRVRSLDEIFASLQPPFTSAEEIDAEIRAGRDEWEANA